jgi:hypothetical protein
MNAKHLFFYRKIFRIPIYCICEFDSGHGLANLTYNADQWETGLEELLRFAQDV